MTETAHEIAFKAEAMVRIVVEMGHLCSLSHYREEMFASTLYQCDCARWLADQDRYGHTFHVRIAVTDQMMASARDPRFVLADAGYRAVREVLTEQRLWEQAEKIYLVDRAKQRTS